MSAADTEAVFGEILDGRADAAQLGALLMGLRIRGETLDELTGAAVAIRRRMRTVAAPTDAFDNCGTGGDAKGTHNISTATSFVAAAGGLTVAKHGSRAASSRSGASDVLTALGVDIDCPFDALERSLDTLGYAFLYAPRHHSAMRHVAPVRSSLKIRTPFNLLGPLCNPAGVKRQLLGCFSRDLMPLMAQALHRLGTERAWLVHGAGGEGGGYDELTTTGDNHIVSLVDGEIHSFTLSPEEAGLARGSEAALRGGTPAENADALLRVLSGERGDGLEVFADTVALNAGCCFVVAGTEDTPKHGVARALEILASGAAREKLEAYAALTRAATNA